LFFAADLLSSAFVTVFNTAGDALVYSTYLAGNSNSAEGIGIAVDRAGNAYVTGDTASSDFPTTPGAFQENLSANNFGTDAFVTKFKFKQVDKDQQD